MRIKKHKNKNEYLLTPQGMWVRNFTLSMVPYEDINKIIQEEEHFLLLKNEFNNSRLQIPWIDTENFYHNKVVIISDGYKFDEKQQLLESLPKDVTLIGINGSLAKWKNTQRNLSYYVVNNPYEECLRYLPRRKIWPKCVASSRTNSDFIKLYKGVKYRYAPVCEDGYSGERNNGLEYQIDDYRNPVCAAISLAYHWGADKILLFCCDDSFATERSGAEKLDNGLWMYPQQRIAHGLIDANFHWFKTISVNQNISIGDHSSGPVYNNATYIEADSIRSFFEGKNE